MCPPGYHHSGFVVTHALGHIMTTYDHLLYLLYILFIMYIYTYYIFHVDAISRHTFFLGAEMQKIQQKV